MHESWPYDDKLWWIDAIHQCISGSSNPHYRAICSKLEALGGNAEDLSALYDETLDLLRSGVLPANLGADIFFAAKALRKWRLAGSVSAETRREKALDGFFARNQEASRIGLAEDMVYLMRQTLDGWLPDVTRSDSPAADLVRKVTGRFGPGACAEHWSHVQRLERLSTWCSDAHWPEEPSRVADARHVCARPTAVPKEETKDRLITVEPGYGTFAQQYVRDLVLISVHHGPLRGTAMDQGWVDGQVVQRRLAVDASKNGAYATIDLKDASDRIPWSLVQLVFPFWVVDLLAVTRSTQVEWRASKDSAPFTTDMHMFAGMGNATTFIVETLFFSAYVKAAMRMHGLRGRVSVFGDDVICTSAAARVVIERHDECFFVNRRKSFLGADALRESCGIFAYRGVDITAPRIDGYRDSWEGRESLCDLHRRLFGSSWPYGQRLSYLISRDHLLVNWPMRAEGYPSLSDPRVDYDVEPKTRWNRFLHLSEAQVPVRECRQRVFPADDTIARARNLPEASSFLQGWFIGLCRDNGIAGRCGVSTFRFPEGSWKVKRRWVRWAPIEAFPEPAESPESRDSGQWACNPLVLTNYL